MCNLSFSSALLLAGSRANKRAALRCCWEYSKGCADGVLMSEWYQLLAKASMYVLIGVCHAPHACIQTAMHWRSSLGKSFVPLSPAVGPLRPSVFPPKVPWTRGEAVSLPESDRLGSPGVWIAVCNKIARIGCHVAEA